MAGLSLTSSNRRGVGLWHSGQRMVGIVVQTLLTDEDLRVRFAIDPIQTLADLNFRGVQLTSEEIDVFVRTDARVWFWNRELVGDQVH